MFKFSGLFDLKPGVDAEEAWQHWREKHVLYAKEYLLPGARKYNINRVVRSFEPVDVWGISEFWFDDVEAALTAIGRLQKAPPDDFYLERIKPAKRVILAEEEIDLSDKSGAGGFKVVSVFTLRPGVDPDEAHRVWRDTSTQWVKRKLLPGARKFTINRVVYRYGEADIYGYSMIWVPDVDTAVKVAERLRTGAPDEFLTKYVKAPTLAIVQEDPVAL